MISVAPGGAVSVWLDGLEIKEVFFGQAEKVNISSSNGFGLPFDSVQESDAYIEKQLVNTLKPEQLESLKKNGIPFGTWARYRNLYTWAPTYKNGLTPIDLNTTVWLLNGEKRPKMPTQFSDELANTPKPLLLKWSTAIAVATGEKYVFKIEFDDFELMEAFEKLGAKGERVNIEIEPLAPKQLTKIRVYNDKDSIELKKTKVE